MERFINPLIDTDKKAVSLVPNYASFFGESLLPPSDEGKRMTPDEFRENHPVRYQIWNALSENLNGNIPDSNFHPSDPETINTLKTRLHMLNQLDRYATTHYSGERGRVLKPRQMRAFEDARDFLEKGKTEGFIKAPTGFGKTVMFGQIVSALDTTTTIVVPRVSLVKQTYKALKRYDPHLDIGRVYERRKEYGRQITITTYESLVLNSQNEDEIRNRAGTHLVIFDEMHRATSENRINAAETFQNAIIFGFSATPVEITDQKVADKRVARMTQQQIHDIPYREAVEEGYISPFSAYIVEVDRDITNVHVTAKGHYDQADLDRVIDEESANQAAVNFFLEMRRLDQEAQQKAGRKTIEPLSTSVYAGSIAHAQHLAKKYQEVGVGAGVVWGEQNSKEQDEIMRKFENGEIEVICSDGLLVEGTNIPRIRMIENVAPTASPVEEQQRCGRGSRIYDLYPEKHLIIADFVYLNSNRKGQQVTFAQVAGGARMVRDNVRAEESRPTATSDIAPEIHIEGLRVTTNPEEVMTMVKRIEDAGSSKDIQSTEFGVSNDNLTALFFGSKERLKKIANVVLEKLRIDHPELITIKTNHSNTITTVTDRDLFMTMMQEEGAKIRVPTENGIDLSTLLELGENEFGVSLDRVGTMFHGDVKSIRKIANEVIEEIKSEHPKLIVPRKTHGHPITAITDKNLFIQMMRDRGIKVKEKIPDIPLKDLDPLDSTDYGVTRETLMDNFSLDQQKLFQISKEVLDEIRAKYPDKIIQKRQSTHRITVVLDKVLFIQMMIQRGAKLKPS